MYISRCQVIRLASKYKAAMKIRYRETNKPIRLKLEIRGCLEAAANAFFITAENRAEKILVDYLRKNCFRGTFFKHYRILIICIYRLQSHFKNMLYMQESFYWNLKKYYEREFFSIIEDLL